ncbi:UDP-galactopyranose mutase [Aestuariivirga sp.]|uniref:UDP-galactopyranose mutase n=1 Tax=Aestuariivirga sp. TaxID=2650926 RepID=UPI003784BDED
MPAAAEVLVVGAGLSGSIIARELADGGIPVTLIEKRSHVAGNCYDYIHASGIRVHKYGPHIFHTSNKKVFGWLSRFTGWVPYEHKVVAKLASGQLVPFPPNRQTVSQVRPDDLEEVFYRPYSEKMWGIGLERLSGAVTGRAAARINEDEDRYFPDDIYQCLPTPGYTELVRNILDHRLITVSLETGFSKSMERNFAHVFNSMAIDEYFDFRFGDLPYRSIVFHHSLMNIERASNFPVINYTDRSPYTRITEWKNFPGHGNVQDCTLLTQEQPCDYKDNNQERYYPVNDRHGLSRRTFLQYKSLCPANMTFVGRCGQYAYLDMDQAASSALAVARRFLSAEKSIR